MPERSQTTDNTTDRPSEPAPLAASPEVLRHRRQWQHRGGRRPDFARPPGPGQESVWDYPRPPRIEPDARTVEVRHGTLSIAASERARRVLETASPPTWYLPPEDVSLEWLVDSGRRSHCEWKGLAIDLDLLSEPRDAAATGQHPFADSEAAGERAARSVAWCYPRTYPEFSSIAGWLAFYPARLDCFVAGERVRPQPGGFYGGWLTSEIVGPVKGEPGIDG